MDEGRVYLQKHTATTAPAVFIGIDRYYLTPETALVWIKILSDYLYCPGLVEVIDKTVQPSPSQATPGQ